MIAPLVSRVAVRGAVRACLQQQQSRAMSRYSDLVVSEPMVRISFAEKCVHGVLIFTGFMGYPIYAMFRVADCRREEYAALEIPDEVMAVMNKK